MKTTNIFKTITIGQYKTNKKLVEAVEKDNELSTYANESLTKIPLLPKEDIDLVVLSVEDLGFKTVTPLEEIYAKAKELGYDLCPPEVGAYLRINYPEQPKNEWLVVAMEPIADSDGGLYVFLVEHNSRGRWLDTYYDVLDNLWRPGYRFVFHSRKLNSGLEPLKLSTLSLELRVEKIEKVLQAMGNLLTKSNDQ